MFHDVEQAFAKLAARQYGVVSRKQAIALGLSPFAISRRVMAGKLREVLPGVYAIPGVPRSYCQRLMAAILWAGEGAVACHRAAASLYDLDGFTAAPVESQSSRAGRVRRRA